MSSFKYAYLMAAIVCMAIFASLLLGLQYNWTVGNDIDVANGNATNATCNNNVGFCVCWPLLLCDDFGITFSVQTLYGYYLNTSQNIHWLGNMAMESAQEF